MPDPTAVDRFTALLAEHGPRLRNFLARLDAFERGA